MRKSVLFISNKDTGDFEVVIEKLPSWEDFEKLAQYLEVNYEADVLEAFDGPDARCWVIKINNEKIKLIHNDGYGNYFNSSASGGIELIKKIGEDLDKWLHS